MTRIAPLLISLSLLLASAPSSAAAVPSFPSDGLIFDAYKLETETELVFFDPKVVEQGRALKQPEYTVEMEGAIRRDDKGLDIIAFTESLTPVRALGNQGTSILLPGKYSNDSAWKGEFSAMKILGAEVELKDVKLTSNPYRLKEMVVMGHAVIAQQRATKILEAIVEEDKMPVVAGISLRLSSMKISSSREVQLDIEYERTEGPSGPILAAVYAIDAQGNELGGGVWDKSEGIFASNIKFKGKFPIPTRSKIDKLKLIFVTVYELKPYAFIVKDVFQK